jgi:glycosyltransferase involved in cell wall biosynthesis
MLISVVIPTYNRAHCIGRALASVKVQGIKDVEVIIGDDASTDDTVTVVKTLMPEVTVVCLPVNQGASAARNAALKLAKGDLIALLDSDDEWLPGKLAKQILFLEEHPEVGLCGSGHLLVCKDGSRSEFPGKNPPDWRRELHDAQSFHGACTPLMRREVLEKVGLLDERLRVLEDWDWMLRISKEFGMHVLPDILTIIHENNPSNPNHTLSSTDYFLTKHREEFFLYGALHARRVISQHYENAARNLFLHHRTAMGCRLLWRSLQNSPLRNPASLVAFPLAALDSILGTNHLPEVLQRRNRVSLRSK